MATVRNISLTSGLLTLIN